MGCFLSKGKSELVLVSGNIDYNKYCSILEFSLRPYVIEVHTRGDDFNRIMLLVTIVR